MARRTYHQLPPPTLLFLTLERLFYIMFFTMKILCVLLPHFSINCEISRRPAQARQPFIITQVEGSQKIVLDFSPELEHLQPGMPLQQALARQGSASLVQADLPYYWSIFDQL